MMMPSTDATVELAALLLAAPDCSSRSAIIANAVVNLLPDAACIVHRFVMQDGIRAWKPLGVAGDLSIEQALIPADSRLFAPLLTNSLLSESPGILLYTNGDFQREDYAHLHVTRSIASFAYHPLIADGDLAGVLEIVAFSEEPGRADLLALDPVVRLAPAAMLAAEESETQRANLLDSVHRMTQLYDLEKSLNATLELDEVIALIPRKAASMLECQAIHLWLFDGGVLRLMSSSGFDATIQIGATQAVGEGHVGDMAEEGEPLLITDAADERLLRRNAGLGSGEPVRNALLVPLLQDESEVGVIEAINKGGTGDGDASPFDEDDQFFLVAVAETVSSALKNASLMHAERKLEILEALVHISSEITSTLRLDRLLQIIVNSPQNVLPFERCAIALDNRGRLQLKAVSGLASLPLGDVQVERLRLLVQWLSSQTDPVHIRQHGDEAGADVPLADVPVEVARHFEATGYRALYGLPLADDQGRVGQLIYESSDPDFLDLPHTEMIKILAGQATVAIRNALLYREVPLIGLLEPLLHKKQALMRTSGQRRIWSAALTAAVVLFLVFCPLPMRVTGEAVIAPQHLVTIAAPSGGNVTIVYAHEGQRVAAGEVLAAMNDWQWRTDLASAEARYQSAMLVMQADLSRGAAQAGADRAQAEYLRTEALRASTRVDNAKLRSPIAGIVVTPSLQNAAGEHLDAGAAFAQVLDLSSAVVDIAIPQRDAAMLAAGQPAAIKLDSYPQRSWHGEVNVVSPMAQAGEGDRSFAVRVPLRNEEGVLRAGMSGRGKVFVGLRPAGYVLLRRPALWLWQTLWNWIGW